MLGRRVSPASLTTVTANALLSRIEGMEGHAIAGDARLAKYFPSERFDLLSPERDVREVANFRAQANARARL